MDRIGTHRGAGRMRLFRAFGWLAVAGMLGLALVGPGVSGAAANQGVQAAANAPVHNDNACNNVKSGADGSGVTTAWTSSGILVSWTLGGTPTVVRGCAFLGGQSTDSTFGAEDKSPSGTSELFTWSVLGLDGDPCPEHPGAAFRGSLDITGVPNTVKGNWAECGSETTTTTSTTETTTTQPTTSTTTTTESTTTTTEPTTSTTTETTTTTTQPTTSTTTTTESTTTTTEPTTTTSTTTTTTSTLTTETFPTEPPFPSFPTEPPATPQTAPPSPTGSVEQLTSSPSGEVAGITSRPHTTPPPTAMDGTTGTPSDGSWRIALIAMAGLLALVLVLTPATSRRRR